jgi:hypothetical protein
MNTGGIDSLESNLGLFKSLTIRALIYLPPRWRLIDLLYIRLRWWRGECRTAVSGRRRNNLAHSSSKIFRNLDQEERVIEELHCKVLFLPQRILRNFKFNGFLFFYVSLQRSIETLSCDRAICRMKTWNSTWYIWFGLWWPPLLSSSSLSYSGTENASNSR